MRILILLFAFTLNANLYADTVAEVNGYKISKQELEDAYKERLMYPSHKRITKESVLEDLINRRLGVDKAKSEKLNNNPEIKERVNDILHNALISRDLQEKFAKIKVSDKEVENYYKNNKEYRTSHILYRVRAVPSKEEVENGYEFMASIYGQLMKKPERFEELAKKHSQVATNQSGGDIGFLPPTSMAPEYYAAIKGRPVGFISKPIRTQFGFHIIKVTGVREFKEINTALYKRILFDMKRDKILDDYYATLKKSSKVKVYKNKL